MENIINENKIDKHSIEEDADDSSTITSSTGRNLNTNNSDEQDELQLAKAESSAIDKLRYFLLGILALSTIGVALAVYFYIDKTEEQYFEENYRNEATKVIEDLGEVISRLLGAIDSIAVAIDGHAREVNSTWPFVTLPNFAAVAGKIRAISGATYLAVYPMVTTAQRAAWEQFSVDNDGWVDEGLAWQAEDENFHGKVVTEWSGWGTIHTNTGPIEREGPYFPTWTSSPVVPIYSPYNWDLYDGVYGYKKSIDSAIRARKPIIGETENLVSHTTGCIYPKN